MAAHEDVEEDQATDDPGDADGHVGGSHEPGQVHASIFNQTWLNSQHPHQRRSSKASVEIKLRQMVLAQEVRDRAEPSRSPETPTSARSGQRPSSPRLLRRGRGAHQPFLLIWRTTMVTSCCQAKPPQPVPAMPTTPDAGSRPTTSSAA